MAGATVAVMLWAATLDGRRPPVPGRTPPFTLGSVEAEGPDGAPTAVASGGPGVVLYVDDGCGFCSEEVGRWRAATRGVPPAWLTVVRARGRPVSGPGIVPDAWAPRTLVDAGGAVAAALGVTGVPYLALIDSLGWVVEVSIGVTAPERIRALIEGLGSLHAKENDHERLEG